MSAAITSPETLLSLDDVWKKRRRRTGQPVHHSSYDEGERERREWLQHNTFRKSDHNAWMRAAETIDDETRGRGKRNGLIGDVGLRVLRELLRMRLIQRGTGRLDPSYIYLAARIRRSRSAVFNAVQRLKALGFLRWLRRTRPVDDPEPGGQYVEQISNAYVLELRGAAAELVARILRRPTEKLRAIVDRRRAEARRKKDEVRPPAEVSAEILAETTDPELKAIFARCFAVFEAREKQSANPPGAVNATLK